MATDNNPKGRRQIRSVAASSHNSQDPHRTNPQAHEQDYQSDIQFSSGPTTPPQTPHKSSSSALRTQPNANLPETGSKHKTRNKNRPKAINASPASNHDRNTPPPASASLPTSSRPMTTQTTAAYAGPTFHASPAPSALPIPSFYSKSVPDSPGIKVGKQNNERPVSNQFGASTPPAASLDNSRERGESPLDFFFKADREEKARARSASSSHNTGTGVGPFKPPATIRNSQTPPAMLSQSSKHYDQLKGSSNSGIFALELDGPKGPPSPYGPAFSTPYAERINAARAASNSNIASEQMSHLTQESLDRSESLKAYLFSSPALQTNKTERLHASRRPSRPQSNGPLSSTESNSSGYHPQLSGRSSGLRQEVTPTKTPTKTVDLDAPYYSSPTPSRSYRNHSNPNTFHAIDKSRTYATSNTSSSCATPSTIGGTDLKGMEDSLRRILKLDLEAGSAAPDSGNLATAVSIPSADRRRPPVNEINHGVFGS